MKLRNRAEPLPGQTGRVCRELRVPSLLRRLQPGDVALVSLPDLDAAVARSLLARKVAAVVNTEPFSTGRYPNLGPRLLHEAGVLLLEVPRDQAAGVRSGTVVRLHEGVVYDGERPLVQGRELTRDDVDGQARAAEEGLGRQLEGFTHNARAFLGREEGLLLQGAGLPAPAVPVAGRPVVVVGHETDRRQAWNDVAGFVRDQHPVLFGVDAGAATLLAQRRRPDAVVLSADWLAAEDDAVVEKIVQHARQVVLHHRRGGDAAGVQRRVERMGRAGHRVDVVRSDADSHDIALLLAHAGHPELLVLCGAERTLEEFLDRSRTDQASNVLTRLRLGDTLVDGRAVPRLYAGRTRTWHLVAILLVGVAALWLAVATTPIGNVWWHSAGELVTDAVDAIKELFGA